MGEDKAIDIDTKCGFVAVMGAPNVGKSTLLNALVGGKVSIVSPKVQTTRSVVRGLIVHEKSQIVLVDTPGVFEPKKRLERAMVRAAWDGCSDADVAMIIVDVTRRQPDEDSLRVAEKLSNHDNLVLVLNKIDKISHEKLLKISMEWNERFNFDATFMISALKENGTKDLLHYLAGKMPEGPYHYDEDQMSDLPARMLAAEITREKLFLRLHQELPYGLTVETEHWEDFDDGSVKISQLIYVAREAHKKIVLGKGGSNIKAVGEAARKEIEELLGGRFHLKLLVKVRENWSEDAALYEAWGLDFNA